MRKPERPFPTDPYLGDIHVSREEDLGKGLKEITDFWVWDGAEWVHSSEAQEKRYLVS